MSFSRQMRVKFVNLSFKTKGKKEIDNRERNSIWRHLFTKLVTEAEPNVIESSMIAQNERTSFPNATLGCLTKNIQRFDRN